MRLRLDVPLIFYPLDHLRPLTPIFGRITFPRCCSGYFASFPPTPRSVAVIQHEASSNSRARTPPPSQPSHPGQEVPVPPSMIPLPHPMLVVVLSIHNRYSDIMAFSLPQLPYPVGGGCFSLLLLFFLGNQPHEGGLPPALSAKQLHLHYSQHVHYVKMLNENVAQHLGLKVFNLEGLINTRPQKIQTHRGRPLKR